MLYRSIIDNRRHQALALRGIIRWTSEKRRQKLRRDSVSTLLNVDDNILRDVVGVSRDDLKRALAAPIDVDAIQRIRLLQKRIR